MAPAAAAAAAAAAATTKTFNPLVQSTTAVLNLVACCGIGVTASKARVLDPAAVSALSRLVYNVFQPSLLFTNVLQTLATPSQSKGTLLLLPLAATVQILLASVVSAAVIRIAGIPPNSDHGRETRVCSTFANSGPLPLLFVDALFKHHPDPSLRPRAIALISFYLLAWSPLFWNYGHGLLVPPSAPVSSSSSSAAAAAAAAASPSRGGSGKGATTDGRTTPQMLLLQHHGSSNKNGGEEEAYDNGKGDGGRRGRGLAPLQRLRRLALSPKLKRVLNPPTLGCTLGAVTGAIPPLRRLFLGEGAPLSSVFDALRTMGAAYVPCVLLVLAGSLAQGLEDFDASVLRRAGVVMAQRFLLMPALTVALVTAGKRLGVIPPTDHLLAFVLLLQGCMPSAQNSVLILQLEKRPQAAASMARLVSTIYLLSILPIGLLLQALLSICPLFP